MKEELLKAENCRPIYLNWVEEGGAEVFRLNYDTFVLFFVPQYGGEPCYINTYSKDNIDSMIEEINSNT